MAVVRELTLEEVPDWRRCHLCGNHSLGGDHVSIEEEKAYQNITCGGCGATWTETYTATMRSEIEEGEPQ